MPSRYARSEELLHRAERTIPLGTQTFSKSKTQYPFGVSPYYLVRGKGSHVWDVDDNEYIDWVNSLAAITLGYGDDEVTAAVRAQLEEGVVFSLPHPIEVAVAEKLVEMVPCAEMARFGKNGSDATSGAVRLARAYTGRDHVAVCGYHGWQDWYIGSTARNLGVPGAVTGLTHQFAYNDIDSLKGVVDAHPSQMAAVIMEPTNIVPPLPGFLDEVAALTRSVGAVFILDETITGFRLANGGAQELYGVTPDLATLGKGMANGYPLSAVVGRADIMRLMEEVFFSFTFGGEALSLAASLATMTKLQREPVVENLARRGTSLLVGLDERIERYGAGHLLKTSGHPSWSFLTFAGAKTCSEWEVKTLFLQEMLKRGILILTTHNMSYAHTDADVAALMDAYDEVLPIIRSAADDGRIGDLLECKPLQPLFRPR